MRRIVTLSKYILGLLFFCIVKVCSAENVVNVFTWAGEIPFSVIKKFEKETGIHVNYSTFDSNEALFAKLRASKFSTYDLVEPSSYSIDRMRRLGLLEKLDKKKLPNFKNLDPFFTTSFYDPDSLYSIPFVWGITGIFINKDYFSSHSVLSWSDLFDKKYMNQLMVLDNSREAFSMMLRMLSYSINDTNPEHIKQAYLKLKALIPNVRLFNSDAVASILIDEDATVGMVWNGDLFKAHKENPKLEFIFPHDGFEIWVDNFCMLKNAPHRENAYVFLNFLMRADIAKEVSMNINYSTANLEARKLMPEAIRNNPILYPPLEVLRRGEFQLDIGEKTASLFEKYWEQLKIGG